MGLQAELPRTEQGSFTVENQIVSASSSFLAMLSSGRVSLQPYKSDIMTRSPASQTKAQSQPQGGISVTRLRRYNPC
jgi:hypothetical protein